MNFLETEKNNSCETVKGKIGKEPINLKSYI
jgi:hypothetical protein